MKDGKRFIIWIILLILIVVLGPLIITTLFLTSSNYLNPLIFIGVLTLAAAIISYYGHIGRK